MMDPAGNLKQLTMQNQAHEGTAAIVQQGASPDSLEGRRFLLLQGPSSRFFLHLGFALRARGGDVSKVGFCPGERIFWNGRAGRYLSYRGRAEAFGAWFRETAVSLGVTDVIMLGDGRTPHAAAIEEITTHRMNVRIWIVEHGYLRPDLILIEPDGMGGASTIPARFLAAGNIAQVGTLPRWKGSFRRYAAMDVTYHASNLALSWLTYPHYRSHSGIHPIREYSGWILKSVLSSARQRSRCEALKRVAAHDGPLFLFPLQLSHDVQLFKSGTGEPQEEILDRVVTSFLGNASLNAALVVKTHPLDNGLTDWRARVEPAGSRVIYLDGGDLNGLLARADGVVTVNSTVGLTALQAGCSTHVLGRSVYRSAGLTDQQPLDEFWNDPQAPDAERVDAFCDFLRSCFHVPGTFDGPGAIAGAKALAGWLAAPPPYAVTDAI
ncbi:capsular biosynthesis protein [Pseudoruegeria sp. HB172150]|uniref:capsular polysaccharide export protein, LipB/KpsS family n=1 Tax=Pseudoruegeria sp. HB172150 TaxID=2721164 RepID=UPI00155517DE|nr:capsular biosynthesis protein [Pseudoruegeria sp. HB172150]